MKALFLDFDGVIRVPDSAYPLEALFCPERMGRVRALLEDTGARLVISSDWRLRYSHAQILEILEPRISPELMHEDWRTPSLQDSGTRAFAPRGAEIVACYITRIARPTPFWMTFRAGIFQLWATTW